MAVKAPQLIRLVNVAVATKCIRPGACVVAIDWPEVCDVETPPKTIVRSEEIWKAVNVINVIAPIGAVSPRAWIEPPPAPVVPE